MKSKNLVLSIFFSLSICFIARSQNKAIADTIDVLSYNINLDLVHLSTHRLSGHTTIKITPKHNGIDEIKLQLLKLTVDSVYLGNVKITTFSYNDTIVKTNLPNPVGLGDTIFLTIYYHGIPQIDASGWGGFYFSSDSSYAYNLGVGFQASPHSYGRVWFPCVDEFPERALYDCFITVKNDKKAVCGGTLMSATDNGNGSSTYHWKLHAEIPSYLASVAVGNYVAVKDTFIGITGHIPIQIYVPATDTNDAKGSFINLKSILGVFESRFGPYLWERVGYVGVPFNSGAMESATNIDYPLFAINGGLTYESLYAHELSHHWFGDLATCSTEFDMWINEGWARYCESIYREGLYGDVAYHNSVRDNHLAVIQTSHIVDNGYRAVYGIPSEYTYSTTVYDKGADMTHTLRHYMGDNLFFGSVKAMLNTYKFRDISTIQMRDFLSTYSGIDLTDFFNAWIFSPGFPHFSIDSFNVTSVTPQIKSRVWVRQRLNHAPAFANSNRIEVTFGNNNWQFYTDTLHFSGQYGTREFTLPFVPDFVMMDYNEKTSDATTDMYRVIKTTGTQTLTASLCNLDVVSVTDSALVRIEHNWVAPDPLKTNNPDIKRLSDYHYWKVDGIFPAGFVSKGKFKYSRIVNTTSGNLDNILLPVTTSVDSLLLLYRKDVSDDWKIVRFTKYGTSTAGYLIVDSLKRGEYAFAVGTPYISYINKHEKTGGYLNVYPNPSNGLFTFSFSVPEKSEIKIFNSIGVEVDSMEINPNQITASWNSQRFKSGTYFARLMTADETIITEKKLLLVK